MTLGTSVQIATLTTFKESGSTTPLVGSMLSNTTPSYDISNVPKRNNTLHNLEVVDRYFPMKHFHSQMT